MDEMQLINWMFIVANIILFCGTSLLIYAVVKDRKRLRGFSPLGAFLTFVPCVIFASTYIILHNWVALGFSSVTVIFWGITTFYSTANWLDKHVFKPNLEGY